MPAWQERLLTWYRRSARPLPWRVTHDPYRIWVSEVMLQQTQVRTVLPYYSRFTERFPTLASLARASLPEVLRRWAGLGYYRRARNLHRAAREIMRRHGGRLPKDLESLRGLPGVGRYTAAAVGSIAFGIRAAVLDGNVHRVLSRVFGVPGPLQGQELRFWKLAEELVPAPRPGRNLPGDWNQALMELGATVCLPRSPLCPACPVKTSCLAYRRGLQEKLPAPAPAKDPVEVRWTCLVSRRDGRLLLERRRNGLLSGHWGLPELRSPWPSRLSKPRLLGTVRHSITHHKLEVRLLGGSWRGPLPKGWSWAPLSSLPSRLVSSLWRKALEVAAEFQRC